MASASNKRVLITGATGFVGSHILEKVIESGFWPVVLVRNCSDLSRIESCLDSCEVHNIGDSLPGALDGIESVDAVIHLATLYKKVNGLSDIGALVDGNLKNSIELYEWALENRVDRFIFFSSYFVCAEQNSDGHCISSSDAFNAYGALKSSVEHYISKRSGEVETTAIRLFTPYGPRDNEKLVMSMIRELLSGGDFEISNPSQGLDLIYVGDVAQLTVKILMGEPTRSGLKVIDLGSGKLTTVLQLKNIMLGILESKRAGVGSVYIEGRLENSAAAIGPKADIRDRIYEDYDLLEVSEGLTKTIRWFIANEK